MAFLNEKKLKNDEKNVKTNPAKNVTTKMYKKRTPMAEKMQKARRIGMLWKQTTQLTFLGRNIGRFGRTADGQIAKWGNGQDWWFIKWLDWLIGGLGDVLIEGLADRLTGRLADWPY